MLTKKRKTGGPRGPYKTRKIRKSKPVQLNWTPEFLARVDSVVIRTGQSRNDFINGCVAKELENWNN